MGNLQRKKQAKEEENKISKNKTEIDYMGGVAITQKTAPQMEYLSNIPQLTMKKKEFLTF